MKKSKTKTIISIDKKEKVFSKIAYANESHLLNCDTEQKNEAFLDRYKVEFFSGKRHKILMFKALVVDENSYQIEKIDGHIDNVSKDIFLDILFGKYSQAFYDKKKISDKKLPKKEFMKIDNGDAISNLKEAANIESRTFGFNINIEPIKMIQTMSLHYEGHDLNLRDGVSPDNIVKVQQITTNIIKTISANNTEYGSLYQIESIAASTEMPFISENYDQAASAIIKKAIDDVEENTIDSKFARSDNKYSSLYKNLLKQMKLLRGVKDLKKFEIKTPDGIFILNNITNIKNIDKMIYGDSVKGHGTIRYYKGNLKSRQNRYVLVIDIGDKDINLHFDGEDKGFKNMRKIAKQRPGTEIGFDGYREGESTIFIQNLFTV